MAGETDMAVAERPAPITPFLRWAGSKRKILHHLQPYWRPTYKRYVEPFAGSSCLFFAIRPAAALLADKNLELIDMYETVRRHPDDVYDEVLDWDRKAPVYYRVRAMDPGKLTSVTRAARFVYLNRNCFNGIFRTNRSGSFNVPFAHSRAGEFPGRDEFRAAAVALRQAELRACDFGTTLTCVRAGDFVYLDPPYAVASRRVFREYGKSRFGEDGLKRLRKHLDNIVDRGADFVLSYAECKEARELAEGWHLRKRLVRRNVAGFVEARRRSWELLISSAEPPV